MLEKMFRSRAEVAVLGVVLFSEGLHLREIARRAGVSPSEAKHELDNLVGMGVLTKGRNGSLSVYSLNASCPFLTELRGLYLKTEGVVPLLAEKLGKLSGVRYAFVYGSFASGKFSERSDVDLMVIGDVNEENIGTISLEAQKKTSREINYILWSEKDFREKLREKGAFIISLIKKDKVWLVGDKNEFERYVKNA